MLTDGQSKNGSVKWNTKGDKFAFHSNRDSPSDLQPFLFDLATRTAVRLSDRKGAWFTGDFSPDDSSLLIKNYVSTSESTLHILSLSSLSPPPYHSTTPSSSSSSSSSPSPSLPMREIHPRPSPVAYGYALFSRDGKGVFCSTDEFSEFKKLVYIRLGARESKGEGESSEETGESGEEGRVRKDEVKILTPSLDWPIETISLSSSGTFLTFTLNEGGVDSLYILNVTEVNEDEVGGREEEEESRVSHRPVRVDSIPKGVITGLEAGEGGKGGIVAFSVNATRSPGDAFVYFIEEKSLIRYSPCPFCRFCLSVGLSYLFRSLYPFSFFFLSFSLFLSFLRHFFFSFFLLFLEPDNKMDGIRSRRT